MVMRTYIHGMTAKLNYQLKPFPFKEKTEQKAQLWHLCYCPSLFKTFLAIYLCIFMWVNVWCMPW